MSTFDDLPMCPVGECRPRLRRMLANGGMANWFDGKFTRVLSPIPALHRPMQKLPWPLSMIQPHLIEFRIYEGESQGDWGDAGFSLKKPVHEHLYKKSEMDVAIDAFLRGSQPDDALIITED